MPNLAYIYSITNSINQKVYIGKTLKANPYQRWKEHLRCANKKTKEKRPLYSAMKKYGVENFQFNIIEKCADNLSSEREKFYIEKYDSYCNGYNATLGGDGKAYLNQKIIIETYLEKQSIAKTSRILHISEGQVSNILKTNNIKIRSKEKVLKDKYAIKVKCKSLNIIFSSITDAAKYIEKNKLSVQNNKHISSKIAEVCKGKRKSAYGYDWEYVENPKEPNLIYQPQYYFENVTPESLIKGLLEYNSISKYLMSLGYKTRNGGYKQFYKFCSLHNIPYKEFIPNRT